jgi:hypothetical protein
MFICDCCSSDDHTVDIRTIEYEGPNGSKDKGNKYSVVLCDGCWDNWMVLDYILFRPDLTKDSMRIDIAPLPKELPWYFRCDHRWSSWQIILPPPTYEKRMWFRRCSICQAKQTKEIA